jgi:hypothetical protein
LAIYWGQKQCSSLLGESMLNIPIRFTAKLPHCDVLNSFGFVLRLEVFEIILLACPRFS